MNDLNQLIQKLKEGDDNAFISLYELFEKPIYNHLLKMLGNESIALEIFQETMLKMIKSIDQYSQRNDLKNSFKAWLFRIATNLAIDEIRKKKKKFELTDLNLIKTTNPVESKDSVQRIQSILHGLPINQRTVLNLRVNEQLSLAEIALVCKCEINAVKQSLFRARQAMKTSLKEEGIL